MKAMAFRSETAMSVPKRKGRYPMIPPPEATHGLKPVGYCEQNNYAQPLVVPQLLHL